MDYVVILHPSAEEELMRIPEREQVAIRNAVAKLEAQGLQLGYPHSSAIQGADRVRELRPRGGNSPWRAFYRQIGGVFVVASIGPEAQVKARNFDRAVTVAEQRLNDVEGQP